MNALIKVVKELTGVSVVSTTKGTYKLSHPGYPHTAKYLVEDNKFIKASEIATKLQPLAEILEGCKEQPSEIYRVTLNQMLKEKIPLTIDNYIEKRQTLKDVEKRLSKLKQIQNDLDWRVDIDNHTLVYQGTGNIVNYEIFTQGVDTDNYIVVNNTVIIIGSTDDEIIDKTLEIINSEYVDDFI